MLACMNAAGSEGIRHDLQAKDILNSARSAAVSLIPYTPVIVPRYLNRPLATFMVAILHPAPCLASSWRIVISLDTCNISNYVIIY